MTPSNGWSDYEKLVLFRLDEQDKKLDTLTRQVNKLTTSVALTKLKLAFIGLASGTLGSAIVYALTNRVVNP